jgi:putative membrane protein
MPMEFHFTALLNALVFAILGVIFLVLSLLMWDKLTPFDLWKEIIEEHNTALAIVVGLTALGISIIIAAAVH